MLYGVSDENHLSCIHMLETLQSYNYLYPICNGRVIDGGIVMETMPCVVLWLGRMGPLGFDFIILSSTRIDTLEVVDKAQRRSIHLHTTVVPLSSCLLRFE